MGLVNIRVIELRVVSCELSELRVAGPASCELRATSCELRVVDTTTRSCVGGGRIRAVPKKIHTPLLTRLLILDPFGTVFRKTPLKNRFFCSTTLERPVDVVPLQ